MDILIRMYLYICNYIYIYKHILNIQVCIYIYIGNCLYIHNYRHMLKLARQL